MKKITTFLFVILPTLIFAQVGIGTTSPDSSAKLDISAPDKGFLPPRVALTGTTDVATISNPAAGLMVYNTATTTLNTAVDVKPGYYYFSNSAWNSVLAIPNKIGGTNFVNSMILGSNVTGTLATATPNIVGFGFETFKALTSGSNNVAIGTFSMTKITTASDNTAVGHKALWADSIGLQNTAVGSSALETNTGGYNTALGYRALLKQTSGTYNTAVGFQAGNNTANTTGTYNTFLGTNTNTTNSTLTNATAIGNGAIVDVSNTIQLGNTAVDDIKASAAITVEQYKLSALNTAPASATAAGTLGEIRITTDSIYVCIATNTWVKAALATF